MTTRNATRRWLVPMCLALLLGGLALPTPAVHAATTYTVNVLTDTGAGAGTTGDLRYALNQVNAGSGGDTITITATGTITLGSALPTLTQSMTINGPGANLLTISGNHAVRAFHVLTDFNQLMSINNLSIANGASDEGGGIYAGGAGTLAVTNSSFTGNTAGAGGAISNAGATCAGGCNSTVTVTNSAFTGNSATGSFGGGAIHNFEGSYTGTLNVTNSTFSGNHTDGFLGSDGGAISNHLGTATVTNSTITGNVAQGYGGGIANDSTLTLTNTIVSGNLNHGNCGATCNDVTPIHTDTTSLIGGTPLLGTLGDYGGPTQTIPLLPGSPAIGAGTTGAGIPTTDQRGVARTGHNDIGAFQSQGFTLTKTGGDNQSQQTNAPFLTPLSLAVAAIAASAPYHEPVQGGTLVVTPAAGAYASVSGIPDSLPVSGQATLAATANDTAGGPYALTIGAGGPYTTAFSLTNLAAPAHSTYTVGTTADHAFGSVSAPTCRTAGNTTCALRDALAYATSGTDTVVFKAGIGPKITPNQGPLTIAVSMTITGPGATTLAIDGGGVVRVFVVNSGVSASISNLTIQHGYDVNFDGGGIANEGTVTVTNTTLTGNDVAIFTFRGTVTVTNSTISGNSTTYGGGIYNGGIYNDGGTVTVTNTIVAGNSADGTAFDLSGPITTGGHNLIGTTSGATITLGPGDLVNPNPRLGPLGSNGGPTQTISLLPGSPAIDAGDDAVCAGAVVSGKDQRSTPRPFGAHCDIGAFEYQVVNTLPGTKPSAPAGGASNPLPAARPAGSSGQGGAAPNPLPASRP